MTQGKGLLLLFFCCLLLPAGHTCAQTPDTLRQGATKPLVTTPAPAPAPLPAPAVEKKGWSRPATAAALSAAVPGLGQVYNGKIWKVPIVYALCGTALYFAHTNNVEYQCFRAAYDQAIISGQGNQLHQVCGGRYTTNGLLVSRDFYRRNRDLSVILLGFAYLLNVLDANVDAHMRNFDVSEDLSLHLEPRLQPAGPGFSPAAGLQLTLNFKK